MSHTCESCGSPYPSEPAVKCAACHDEAEEFARAKAHGTGYAAAVADIRQLVLTAANRQSAEMFRAKGAVLRRIYGTVSESLFGLLEAIAAGAHVGAAKKGAT